MAGAHPWPVHGPRARWCCSTPGCHLAEHPSPGWPRHSLVAPSSRSGRDHEAGSGARSRDRSTGTSSCNGREPRELQAHRAVKRLPVVDDPVDPTLDGSLEERLAHCRHRRLLVAVGAALCLHDHVRLRGENAIQRRKPFSQGKAAGREMVRADGVDERVLLNQPSLFPSTA